MDQSVPARAQLEDLLYGSHDALRFTQDTPVLPDVWMEYARQPRKPLHLLVTPYQDQAAKDERTTPGQLCQELFAQLAPKSAHGRRRKGPALPISYNQSVVLVEVDFTQLIGVILPMSKWWRSRGAKASADDRPRGRTADAPSTPPLPPLSLLLKKLRTAKGQKEVAAAIAREGIAPAPDDLSPDVLWMVRVVGTKPCWANTGERSRSSGASGRRWLGLIPGSTPSARRPQRRRVRPDTWPTASAW